MAYEHLIFLTVTDNKPFLYYDSIQWIGMDVQVRQDVIWQNFETVRNETENHHTHLLESQILNIWTIEGIDALNVKMMSSLSNVEALIHLKLLQAYFQIYHLILKQLKILLTNHTTQEHCNMW